MEFQFVFYHHQSTCLNLISITYTYVTLYRDMVYSLSQIINEMFIVNHHSGKSLIQIETSTFSLKACKV
jgi:hypothetical protein